MNTLVAHSFVDNENVAGSISVIPRSDDVRPTAPDEENLAGSLSSDGSDINLERGPVSSAHETAYNVAGSLLVQKSSDSLDRGALSAVSESDANVFGTLGSLRDESRSSDAVNAMGVLSVADPPSSSKAAIGAARSSPAAVRISGQESANDSLEEERARLRVLKSRLGHGAESARAPDSDEAAHRVAAAADKLTSAARSEHDGEGDASAGSAADGEDDDTAAEEWERKQAKMALAVSILRAGGDASLERAVKAGAFRSPPRRPVAAPASLRTAAAVPTAAMADKRRPTATGAAAAVAGLRAGLVREAQLMNRLHQDLNRRRLLLAAAAAARSAASHPSSATAAPRPAGAARKTQEPKVRSAAAAAGAAAGQEHVQGLRAIATPRTAGSTAAATRAAGPAAAASRPSPPPRAVQRRALAAGSVAAMPAAFAMAPVAGAGPEPTKSPLAASARADAADSFLPAAHRAPSRLAAPRKGAAAAGGRAEAVAERVGEGLGAGLCAVLGLAC